MLGVLTLENVIERILQMDIKDEKDIDKMKIATSISGKRGDNGKLSVSNTRTISMAGQKFYRQHSIHYDKESDDSRSRQPS